MTSRDDILDRIRASEPAPTALPQLAPLRSPADKALLTLFKAAVVRMGGKVIEAGGHLDELVRELHRGAKVIVSATPEVEGNRKLDPTKSPAFFEGVDVGVVRARFGVAETGSVWITDADFGVSALGFLSQHLIVLLDPEHLILDMHHAYARRAEFEASYGVFMTGPSATADIEGVLIHGAQGIRSLTVVLRAAEGGSFR